jgi:hypothetical protein
MHVPTCALLAGGDGGASDDVDVCGQVVLEGVVFLDAVLEVVACAGLGRGSG